MPYNLNLFPLQCRLQHMYHGHPYARVNLDPMLKLTLSPSQWLWIWPPFSTQSPLSLHNHLQARGKTSVWHFLNLHSNKSLTNMWSVCTSFKSPMTSFSKYRFSYLVHYEYISVIKNYTKRNRNLHYCPHWSQVHHDLSNVWKAGKNNGKT